jgi:hypothetical protein
MKPWLVVAALLALTATAQAECYVSEENPMDTLTEGRTKHGYGFIWKQGGKTIELSTGGIGTGIIARQASELESDEVHTYLYVRDVLVFDMVPYDAGCGEGSKIAASPREPVGFDAQAVMKIYDEAGRGCTGLTADGKEISDQEAREQCLISVAVGEQLKSYGYCWDLAQSGWLACQKK